MSLSSKINTLPISCLLFIILLCSFLCLLVHSISHFIPLTADASSLSQTSGAHNLGVSNLSDEAAIPNREASVVRYASQTRQHVADIRSSPEECASLMGVCAALFQLTSESGNKKHRGSILQPPSGPA